MKIYIFFNENSLNSGLSIGVFMNGNGSTHNIIWSMHDICRYEHFLNRQSLFHKPKLNNHWNNIINKEKVNKKEHYAFMKCKYHFVTIFFISHGSITIWWSSWWVVDKYNTMYDVKIFVMDTKF